MKALPVLAAGEAATGVGVLLFPQLVVQLLFGVEVAGAGVAISRVAGMALLALGIACWPGAQGRTRHTRTALLVYNALATFYLGVVAAEGELRGPMLWPAVAVHLAATVWLAKAWATGPDATPNGESRR